MLSRDVGQLVPQGGEKVGICRDDRTVGLKSDYGLRAGECFKHSVIAGLSEAVGFGEER